MRWLWVALAFFSAAMFGISEASAQQPADVAVDIDTLDRAIDDALAQLATSDCGVICSALASMNRAAERICQLAPGPRCDAARAKVAAAQERTRQTCPDCSLYGGREQKNEVEHEADDLADAEAAPPAPAAAAGPPAEDASSGGCAACTLGGRQNERGAGLLFLLGIGLAAGRRRRR
jgi:MYXO-CTERM domain-containing protein